jgi:predicted AAA+ superfamily ATPase
VHDVFKEFKDAIAEQFALQELKPKNLPIYYWSSSTGQAEVDFVIQYEDKIKRRINKFSIFPHRSPL